MKNILIFFVFVFISCSSDIVILREEISFFSYSAEEITGHAPIGSYEVLIENLTKDTIIWEKDVFISDGADEDILFNAQKIIIPPFQKVNKRITLLLNKKQLEKLNSGEFLNLYFKRGNFFYKVPLDNEFEICQKNYQVNCDEKRPKKLFLIKQV